MAGVLLVMACSERTEGVHEDGAAAQSRDPRRCQPAAGTTGSPSTIAEAVALINGLPSPVTAECFVEALDRPLRIEASKSSSSLQPAQGERSPRIFIFSGESLTITVVVDGPGRNLIEFGEAGSPNRTLKGELAFPLTVPVSVAEPHLQVRNREYPNITRCFVCHDAEQPSPTVHGGLESIALRPAASTLVSVDVLLREHQACNRVVEPERCAYLEALVTHGPIQNHPFPEKLSTF